MNYLELINKCLVELNYKSVGAFDDLITGDHKRLKEIINRLNNELVLGYDWSFREAKSMITLISGEFEHYYPIDGKISAVYYDDNKCFFEPDYEKFYRDVNHEQAYSIYANKFLMGAFDEDTDINIFYYSNKPAKSTTGELKDELSLESDESVIPAEYASNVLVYGACMRFKAMPNHPKYKHWSGEYLRALRSLQGANIKCEGQEPAIKVNRG